MADKHIYLDLALHNHQPVGNPPQVFDLAFQRAYLPMVEALERHPTIRLSLHYSGPLLYYLEANQPQFLDRLAALVARGQVELMTSGYYEPILAAIPQADRLGQIRKMSAFLKARFGQEPTGLWLAERVWEPDLPQTLAQAGVEWTVVDDTHFQLVGHQVQDLFGYYVTEDQGAVTKVFPSSKYLRYSLPWQEVEELIAYLRRHASGEATPIAVMGDDGEKFGLWPGTYQLCWKGRGVGRQGGVERFFRALEANQDWLSTIPLGEYARSFSPLGRVYLPTASYEEMMEWALPAQSSYQLGRLRRQLEEEGRQDIVQYLHGGFWRSFMAKYPEINAMHKKMLRVHRQVYQARSSAREEGGLDELWKAQGNCPYWHGVFGGIYLNSLRAQTYSHLIEAQNQAQRVLHGMGPWLHWEMADLDCDGAEELIIEGTTFNLYLDPEEGGCLFEWDLRRPPYNLASTLSRRPEAYHQELLDSAGPAPDTQGQTETIHAGLRVKEAGLARRLHYDGYRRVCLIDHFLPPGANLAQFEASTTQAMGDFVSSPYRASVEASPGELRVLLTRDGHLRYLESPQPLRVEKELRIRAGEPRLVILYRLVNTGRQPAAGVFATEWSINLQGGKGDPEAYLRLPGRKGTDRRMDSRGLLRDVEALVLGNRRLGIEMVLRPRPSLTMWHFPLEAISNSEGGLERTHQGTCILPLLPFHLGPGETCSFSLEWEALS